LTPPPGPQVTSVRYSPGPVSPAPVQKHEFEPPLLASKRPDAIQPSVFVGNIDGRFGDDIVSLNDARVLAGDPKEKFGFFFISTPTGFETQSDYSPPVQFSRKDKQDRGVRIVDLHGRGLPDVIFRRDITENGAVTIVDGAYRNTGAGWVAEPGLKPPVPLASDDLTGNPVQFADVAGSG
jgi:hypothetical protein